MIGILYESQYEYIKNHPEQYRKYARDYYHRLKANPDKLKASQAVRKTWYDANKQSLLDKQREKKRQRKLESIEYLGGRCKLCKQTYHPSVYEFHHRDPVEKDRDPSKMLALSWVRLKDELDKCDLLCANCHRFTHHNWEVNDLSK